jgi:beta-phosphoglucomutase-like phosphatase (HAD superfamily)
VATSTRRDRAEAQLTQQGLLARFAALVGGNEVERGKPEPDIFLLAASRLAVAAADCVVLEDSEPGVRAALAAGMMPIMVPDLHGPSENLLAREPLVLPSLHHVRAHLALLPR